MASEMNIEVTEHEGITVLGLDGSIDSSTTPTFEAELARAIDAGAKRILIDLSGVDFISSAGLGAFLVAARKLAPGGGTLSVSGPNDSVRDVFDLSGFSTLFKIFHSEGEALANM